MHTNGSQRTACRSQVSPFTMWVPEVELCLSGWAASNPMSHLISLLQFVP